MTLRFLSALFIFLAACNANTPGDDTADGQPEPAQPTAGSAPSNGADGSDGWVTTRTGPDGAARREVLLNNGDSVEVRVFHENGALDRIGRYREGRRHGVWQAFYPNGLKWSEHFYEDGVQTGAYTTYHPNGELAISGQYDAAGQPTGVWEFFNEKGEVIETREGAQIKR